MKYIIGCSFSIFFFIFILNEYLQNNVYFFECYIKKCIIFFSLAMIRFYSECEMCFIKTKKSLSKKIVGATKKYFGNYYFNNTNFLLFKNYLN